MARERRTKTVAFSAKPSEKERIDKVADLLGLGMSEYMRNLVMADVVKQEKLENAKE